MKGRAQAFTLEAFVAALLLLGSLVFALQVTGLTASTASTSSEQVEGQLEGTATGVLDAAIANESLRPTLLYWNTTGEQFFDAEETHYVSEHPPTRFGAMLERTVGAPRLVTNVHVRYVTADGDTDIQKLVHHGTPTDQAVTVARTVTLYDSERLYSYGLTPDGARLANTTRFYAPDIAPDSPLYNVFRVEVTVWYV